MRPSPGRPTKQLNQAISYFNASRGWTRVSSPTAIVNFACSDTYIDLEQEEPDKKKAAILKAYLGSSKILEKAKSTEKFQTFARIGDELVVLSFAHVKMSDNSGAPQGFVAMVREIEPDSIEQQLHQKSGYDFRLISGKSTTEILPKTINVGVSVKGVDGNPVSTIRYVLVRDLAAVGRNMLLLVGVGIALLVFIMIGILDWRLRTAVVAPLVTMEDHVRQIEKTKIISTLEEDDRRDEIGTLQKAFNSMAEQLLALRSELEAQSFELGKNQSAIGVMHNVRNGLSPVFTFLSRTEELLQNSAQDNIARALSEMGQEDLDDERRKKLASFLGAAVDQYDQKLDLCRIKANEAGLSLSSVLEAIEQVQDDDMAMHAVTDCDISTILTSGLVTARHASGKQITATQYDGDSNHAVRANRVLLTQVIVNVLTNAAEAIAATGRDDGQINVSQTVVESQNGPMLQVTITDNGDGFEPELAAKLFERGYSTRSGKSGGLGLHWCSNTLNAMGGSIYLESIGKGEGTTAVVKLALSTEISLAA